MRRDSEALSTISRFRGRWSSSVPTLKEHGELMFLAFTEDRINSHNVKRQAYCFAHFRASQGIILSKDPALWRPSPLGRRRCSCRSRRRRNVSGVPFAGLLYCVGVKVCLPMTTRSNIPCPRRFKRDNEFYRVREGDLFETLQGFAEKALFSVSGIEIDYWWVPCFRVLIAPRTSTSRAKSSFPRLRRNSVAR